jgi:hypothetical protein
MAAAPVSLSPRFANHQFDTPAPPEFGSSSNGGITVVAVYTQSSIAAAITTAMGHCP